MSALAALKASNSLHDVARVLGLKPSRLAYILYKLGPQATYRKFEIPKKFGGTRAIAAPLPPLAAVQRRLAGLLYECISEIRATTKTLDAYSHGFEKARSIKSNALQHRARRYVFNTDLKDFFGTLNFGRVRGYFLKSKHFQLRPPVATVIAQIACFENALPQGSPCSPVIANLVAYALDLRLVRLAMRARCRYTRYADDLTFSTNAAKFPEGIACRLNGSSDLHDWAPGPALLGIIDKCGFSLNFAKTRMQYRNSRQEVTGLTVNRMVNARAEYRKAARAMVNRLVSTGSFQIAKSVSLTTSGRKVEWAAGTLNQLHGMLGFISFAHVPNVQAVGQTSIKTSNHPLSAFESTFRRFLLYKDFYAAAMPVIVAEGSTDNIYLTHAIRSLATAFPELASVLPDGSIELKVRLYRYSGTASGRVLRVHGGSADLSYLMRTYHSELKRLSGPGLTQPVIFVGDNDKGAAPIHEAIKQIASVVVDRSEDFVHVTGNLYFLATPLLADGSHSCIEDSFSEETKAVKVAGKYFDPHTKGGGSAAYGKIVFAHQVVAKQHDTIDFAGFRPLLSRIVRVIKEHGDKVAAAYDVVNTSA